jgi:hypothetical protein
VVLLILGIKVIFGDFKSGTLPGEDEMRVDGDSAVAEFRAPSKRK